MGGGWVLLWHCGGGVGGMYKGRLRATHLQTSTAFHMSEVILQHRQNETFHVKS